MLSSSPISVGELESQFVFAKDYGEHLFKAWKEGDLEFTQLLLNSGAKVNDLIYFHCKSNNLVAACSLRNYSVVKLLLDSGADVNGASEYESPLTASFSFLFTKEKVNYTILRLLIDRGADVNQRVPDTHYDPSKKDAVPLYLAVSANDVEAVKILLQANADPHLKNDEGRSSLEFAQFLLKSHQMNPNPSVSQEYIRNLVEIIRLIEEKKSLS